jgi:hypothetical protein
MGYDSSAIRASNGGQFGLSLGRLLTIGGMMKPVARSPVLCWAAVKAGRPATARSES